MLCGIEKGQGLKKGERIKRLGQIQVVSSRREPLRRMTDDLEYGFQETVLEGFPELSPKQFVGYFCFIDHCTPDVIVNRIEFKRMD
jgi:hypothetical protein